MYYSNMGKRGKINLVMPKNSGTLTEFEKAIDIVYKQGGYTLSTDWEQEMSNYLERAELGTDKTSAIHKSVMPRYFGLLNQVKEAKVNFLELTPFGKMYIEYKDKHLKTDLILDVIQTITFGRDNNGVKSSDSNVEAPVAFLKYVKEQGQTTQTHFGCLLFYLEVEGLSYQDSVNKINALSDLAQERRRIIDEYGNKLFDTKFPQIFEALGITIQDGKDIRISNYVLNNHSKLIDDLFILSSQQSYKPAFKSEKEQININEEIKDILNKFHSTQNHSQPLFLISERIKNKTRKNGTKKSTKQINFGRNKRQNRISDENKNEFGWGGEKYIYSLMKENSLDMLKLLDFSVNEIIEKIEWFNLGFENDLKNWSDKSQGKGCDIIIQTSIREIHMEVKTSWDNINYYTVTNNELRSMYDCGESYFLVKVNKFKNIVVQEKRPEIRVFQDPIKLLDQLDNIKTVTLNHTF